MCIGRTLNCEITAVGGGDEAKCAFDERAREKERESAREHRSGCVIENGCIQKYTNITQIRRIVEHIVEPITFSIAVTQ